jgi:hypothetical protein
MRQIFTPAIRLLFITVPLFISSFLDAQEVSTVFRIFNHKAEPVAYATITVKNRLDSTQIISKIADSAGTTSLTLTINGQYIVTISSAAYQPLEKGITVSSDRKEYTFHLEELKTLGGVVVRSSKPLLRQEDDKTIVDPESLAASSTSGYEVLEKVPGLFVDQDGNIYIASTTPASILINGRELKMSAADVATMLKSLPPNAIASIEIVRTPSAKYDASGSGGVVNVILRRGVKLGLTGGINTGIQQGKYGNQFAGFNLNNTAGGLSSYVNVNLTRRNNYDQIITDRIFSPDSLLSQDAYSLYPSTIVYLGFGLSYDATKKWQLGYDARMNNNWFDNNTENRNIIRKISTGEEIINTLNSIDNKGNSFSLNQGIDAKYKIDSIGSEWTSGISYTYASNKSDQHFYTNPNLGGGGEIDNKRHFITAQTDLSWKFPGKFTIEAGLKTSFLRFNSFTDYYSENNGVKTKDDLRTNTFRYSENINSAYLQGAKTIVSDLLLKVGVRMENTNMNGHQVVPIDTSFSIHRADLFPYVYLSKKLVTIAGFELRSYLVYRRTITRPVYEQLNPFPRYIDQFLTEIGNPRLRPQFNTNYEANVSVNETPILAIGINQTRDIFTNVVYSFGTQAFRTYDNLGRNKEFYLRGLGAIPPGGKYFFVLGGQYNHNFYDGLYQNQPFTFKRGSWTFFTYHSLKLGKRSQFTLNGFMRLKGQMQFYELSSFGMLNASINRQFLKQKLVVTISMNDMFYTLNNDFHINQGTVNATGTRMGDTRRVGLNIRYSFGIRKKDESNNMFNIESPEKTN